MLDRIDIQIEIVPVPFEKLSEDRCGENSATIRARVLRARKIQEERFEAYPGIYCMDQFSNGDFSIKGVFLERVGFEVIDVEDYAEIYEHIWT